MIRYVCRGSWWGWGWGWVRMLAGRRGRFSPRVGLSLCPLGPLPRPGCHTSTAEKRHDQEEDELRRRRRKTQKPLIALSFLQFALIKFAAHRRVCFDQTGPQNVFTSTSQLLDGWTYLYFCTAQSPYNTRSNIYQQKTNIKKKPHRQVVPQ